MAQIQETDLTSKDLILAFNCLSAHVKTTFPKVLPLEVFTVGGAMIVILLRTRPTTHDVDVSGKLLEACYHKEYPNIEKSSQPSSGLIIGTRVIEKVIEDNIILLRMTLYS
jgi:hypothetical protein